LLYRSNPFIIASVLCFMNFVIPPPALRTLPASEEKSEDLFRDSLVLATALDALVAVVQKVTCVLARRPSRLYDQTDFALKQRQQSSMPPVNFIQSASCEALQHHWPSPRRLIIFDREDNQSNLRYAAQSPHHEKYRTRATLLRYYAPRS
jgi:hypothetical protein